MARRDARSAGWPEQVQPQFSQGLRAESAPDLDTGGYLVAASPTGGERSDGQKPSERDLRDRLHRIAWHVKEGREFGDWLTPRDPDRALRISKCGGWLLFKHYHTHPDQPRRLAGANFCCMPRLCGFCAAMRSHRHAQALLRKFETVMAENPGMVPYLATLTRRNQQELRPMAGGVWAAWNKLTWARRGFFHRKRTSHTPILARFVGGFTAGEAKRGKGSGQWHYHLHGVWLGPPDENGLWQQLQEEWSRAVGHYCSVNLQTIEAAGKGVMGGILEASKYSVKLSGATFADRLHAADELNRLRALRCWGDMYGCELPDELVDDTSDLEAWPWVEVVYRYLEGVGYVETKEFDRMYQSGTKSQPERVSKAKPGCGNAPVLKKGRP